MPPEKRIKHLRFVSNLKRLNRMCRKKSSKFEGLETLSQLVLSDGGDPAAAAAATYTLPGVPWKIADAPRFPFRGLMVDTSRHFLPLNALRRQIDGLSFSRMSKEIGIAVHPGPASLTPPW